MGYDMRWEDPLTPEEEATRDAAKAHWEAALAARDAAFKAEGRPRDPEAFMAHPAQQEVDRASDEYNAADGYFRLNIGGMSVTRDALEAAGAIHDKMGNGPDYPRLSDFELADYPDEDSDDLTDAERKYLASDEAWRTAGVEYLGIPAHKLCSNDAWLVTFAECLSAAKARVDNRPQAVAELGEDHPGIGLADKFMAFAAEAAKHGGFRVR